MIIPNVFMRSGFDLHSDGIFFVLKLLGVEVMNYIKNAEELFISSDALSRLK